MIFVLRERWASPLAEMACRLKIDQPSIIVALLEIDEKLDVSGYKCLVRTFSVHIVVTQNAVTDSVVFVI